MTAVLAAARWLAIAVLEAVLVLAAVAAVFWAALSPPGQLATMARLAVMFVTISGAVLGVSALQPKGGGGPPAGRPDYERIAELERGLYGHTFPDPAAPEGGEGDG